MRKSDWRGLLLLLGVLMAPALPAQELKEPALAAVEEEAAPEPETDPEEERVLLLRNFVASWASAWQSQFDDIYLLHYHPDFMAEGFSTRAEWEASRRSRLVEPGSIRIGLREFELVQSDSSSALLRFRLDYSRPGYADETWKELQLARNGELWQILRERNLAVQHVSAP
jgi:hypothetical protein